MTDTIAEEVVATVLARAAGACERCGRPINHLQLHHRKPLALGGLSTVENLVALCGWGMQTGCHGWVHQVRPRGSNGFSLNSWESPVDVALYVGEDRIRFLPHEPWISVLDRTAAS